MKKLIIIITGIIFLISIAGLGYALPYNVNLNSNKLLYYQYFDNETIGTDPAPGWTKTNGNPFTWIINNTVYNGSAGKSIEGKVSGYNPIYSAPFKLNNSQQNITIEYDIKFNNPTTKNKYLVTVLNCSVSNCSAIDIRETNDTFPNGQLHFFNQSTTQLFSPTLILLPNVWYHFKIVVDISNPSRLAYLTVINTSTGAIDPTRTFTMRNDYDTSWNNKGFYFFLSDLTTNLTGWYDNIIVYNGTVLPTNISNVTLYNINCTSCNEPNGDTISPYTTPDTTPTFTLNTNTGTDCRISSQNYNYTQMNSTRDCTSGLYHTCTLNTIDELIYPTSYVYIACSNGLYENYTGPLQMEITNLIVNSSIVMQWGVEGSEIWPGATVYNNQKVYLRSINNSQLLITADKVAAYGNQRWIFNYVTENETKINGLFNISPVVYVWQSWNLSLSEIQRQVSDYINSTKS